MKYEKISGFSDEIAEDIDTQFRVLKKLNIRYFEPRGIDGKSIADLSDEEAAGLKQKMKENGITVSSIGSPIGKVRLEDDFEEHFAQFKRVVEIARMLDARYIRMFSFYHQGGEVWSGEERKEVLARLGRMVAYAKEQKVVLLHENEKGIYGDTAERCADLMKELGCDNFRAVFDPANFVQCGEDTRKAYEAVKEHIAYVHIKDAFLADGRVVPAGSGDGNVEYVLEKLFEAGYDGFLSIEPHLGSFAGLENLELDDKMAGLPQGGEGTFTLAYRALEEILERVL
ncbi:MAG: sugar phosphate isomerase/epimerase [Lachnospiraceae bacterium]|nr:sugar phosphate isomerase/epimerase [Lachnospiraceae bacterium]